MMVSKPICMIKTYLSHIIRITSNNYVSVRQKDNAKSSITEVVHIVKNSCLDIQTTSQNSTDSAIKDNADNDNPKAHGKDNLIGVRSPSKIVGGTSDHNKNSRKSLRGPGRSLLG